MVVENRGVKWMGWVGLKLGMLKWLEIEIRLGYDPFKFTSSSNGLGLNGLKVGLTRSISAILTYYYYYYLFFMITI